MNQNAPTIKTFKTKDGRSVHCSDDDDFILEMLRLGGVDLDQMKARAKSEIPNGEVSFVLPSQIATAMFMYFFGNPNQIDNGWRMVLLGHDEWEPEEAKVVLNTLHDFYCSDAESKSFTL